MSLLGIWPFRRSLGKLVGQTKRVRVHGVPFTIRKLDPLAYLTGSQIMVKLFDEYEGKRDQKTAAKQAPEALMKAARDHYRDVFLQTVVEPKLVRKPEDAVDGAIPVDHLLTEWALAVELYMTIVEFTYGKKKALKSATSLAAN